MIQGFSSQTVRITPTTLSGTIAAIASKSDAHRHLICAALSDTPTELLRCSDSEDIDATIGCLRALGTVIEKKDRVFSVEPLSNPISGATLDCVESGSTLRFMLPVAVACSEGVHLTGRGRLPERPLGDLVMALRHKGVEFSSDRLPITTRGTLCSGSFMLPGNISSQYITGMLLALPKLPGESEIVLTTPLESRAYVDITLKVLAQYGILIEEVEDRFIIPPNQHYRSPGTISIEGDWSNAAFFLAAGAICAPLTVTGLALESPQGDRKVVEFLQRFGAKVTLGSDSVSVSPRQLSGCSIDIGETPDLLPILAVVASTARGKTEFTNAARLRLKESDRLQATATLIRSLGGEATESSDSLVVHGGSLAGGVADSYHDHRIAMAAAVAALICSQPVTIQDAGSVAKSYPAFFTDYQALGGEVNGI